MRANYFKRNSIPDGNFNKSCLNLTKLGLYDLRPTHLG